jgi:hypothetical protein
VRSIFPPEAPSFCSRPTPVVPARTDLRTFPDEHAAAVPDDDTSAPPTTPSSRPTYVPDDPVALATALAAAPTVEVSFDEAAPLSFTETELASGIVARPTPPPPKLHVAPRLLDEPAHPEERRSMRPLVSRGLFVLLFGAVVALLGYAFRAQLGSAMSQARARVDVLVGAR